MAQAFVRFVDYAFRGHVVYSDQVEPADSKGYLKHIRHNAQQRLEQDLCPSLYVDGHTHQTQIMWSAYHYARIVAAIHSEMMRLVLSDAEFQEIKLRAIL